MSVPLFFRHTRISQNQESGRINGNKVDLHDLDIKHRFQAFKNCTNWSRRGRTHRKVQRILSFFIRYKLTISSTQPLPCSSRASIHPLVVPSTLFPRNLRYPFQLPSTLHSNLPIHLSYDKKNNKKHIDNHLTLRPTSFLNHSRIISKSETRERKRGAYRFRTALKLLRGTYYIKQHAAVWQCR